MPDSTETAETLVLAPQLVVVLRHDGLEVQQKVMAEPLPIDLAGLHLLARLDHGTRDIGALMDEVAAETGVDRTEVRDFQILLRMSGNLLPGVPWAHPPAEDHPDVDAVVPAAIDPGRAVSLALPLTFRIVDGRFELLDHDGFRWLVLDPWGAAFVSRLAATGRPAESLDEVAARPGCTLRPEDAALIVGRLGAAGFLHEAAGASEPGDTDGGAVDRDELLRRAFEEHFDAQNAREEARRRETGEVRPRVVPVAFDMGAPAGVAMVVAYAKGFEGGRLDEAYEMRTDWLWNDDHLEHFTEAPAVWLFSNYLWSHEQCLAVSKRVKELSPGSVTVHGGPDTPKYPDDVARHFAAHPHVDVTVRGEGEATTAELLSALQGALSRREAPDLSVLHDVAGLTYRGADGPVRTADRERIAEVDSIPSPFLTGLFDVFSGIPDTMVTMETNRGCPYGCTFCDWGSATTSRVRKYAIERVFDELTWCAEHRVGTVGVADANFGMFARDVEIAEKVAELRKATGFPLSFGVSYAKNTVKHLEQIIGVLSGAGVMSQGVLSLQSMDEETLRVIHRSNIKTERYDALADRMREARLPLMVELMMGLPGQTVGSFLDDLQQCIEREVPARINRTTLLVNSPMNEPAYLAENRIELHEPLEPGRNSLVISTSSYSRADWMEMERMRIAFGLFENYSVLRIVSRFVRQQTGVREVDLYRDLAGRVGREPGTYPVLDALGAYGAALMAPVYSWDLMATELRRYLGAAYGVAGTGLDAVLAAQKAILPAPGRRFPSRIRLEHDVATWYHDVLRAKGEHGGDWTSSAVALEDLPPADLEVGDPSDVCGTSLGINPDTSAVGASWELESPLGRAHIAASQLHDWARSRMFRQRVEEGAGGRGAPVSISRAPARS